MARVITVFLLSTFILTSGCDSDPQEDLIGINISGVVSAESTGLPLDSVRVVLVPPPDLGSYPVDEDSTGADGRYEIFAETDVVSQGFCSQAGGLLFIKDGYHNRIAAFVPPGLEEEAGEDDAAITWVPFTCDDEAKSISVSLFDETAADTTAGADWRRYGM